ncbi:hypothetical protein [Streptomyces sp. NPDC001537]
MPWRPSGMRVNEDERDARPAVGEQVVGATRLYAVYDPASPGCSVPAPTTRRPW